MTVDKPIKKFLLFLDDKKRGSIYDRHQKNQDLKLKNSSEKIKYILWSTSAMILVLFLAKRIKMF